MPDNQVGRRLSFQLKQGELEADTTPWAMREGHVCHSVVTCTGQPHSRNEAG